MIELSNQGLLIPLLLAIYFSLLAVEVWRQIKGARVLRLVDAFNLGLFLYILGATFVWIEGVEFSEKLLVIACLSGISALSGVFVSGHVLRGQYSTPGQESMLGRYEVRLIDFGLVVCALVSAVFLVAVYANAELRYLFHETLNGTPGALNTLRVSISSGIYGYFMPGYVKQFRDIAVPILCVALVMRGALRGRAILFILTLFLCCGAIYVSGQRLVIIQYILCLLIGAFIAYRRSRDLKTVAILSGATLLLLACMELMTLQLGRTDVALSPAKVLAEGGVRAGGASARGSTSELFSKKLSGTDIPPTVAVAIALAHRATIAVPRENVMMLEWWEEGGAFAGAGWVNDLASIRPGTQRQISNELSNVQGSSDLGNSPLGMPADLFYNWKYVGVTIFPFLFAFLWVLWDRFLARSPYAIVKASRIFLFFSIPLMYSPFMFVLYGGGIVMLICVGMWMLERLAAFLSLHQKLG